MKNRSNAFKDYRYGFNGKENDNEVKGQGNSLEFGERIYDSRLGRWSAVDFYFREYPFVSTYAYAMNTPLQAMDPDGQKVFFVNGYWNARPELSDCRIGAYNREKYWGAKFKTRAMDYLNDHKASFVDGTGSWNSTGKERYDAGYKFAEANYNSLVGDILDENGVQTETIKIVSHSMGGAYSEGMIKYFEERNLKVEKVIHFSPADPSDFTASTTPNTIQLNLENDPVLMYKNFGENNLMANIDRAAEVQTERSYGDDLMNSHGDTKYDASVFDMIKDIESVEMVQENNTCPFPFNAFSGYSNTYRETNSQFGTVFNKINIRGSEFTKSDGPSEFQGPLR